MAIIVKEIATQNKYVLIGSSFSYYKEISEHKVFKFLRNTEEGEFEVITIVNEDGDILFRNADEFRVIEIDGKPIAEII